ncbi:uncharacterized protein LOC107794427 [Nicotiana tabacum]|uniref:Uncharacterized protein LOC107794427 n=5 Tax=Nicotiana tabacum TaxID=4097 RepID=A0AC58UVA3_TOBAC
MPPAETTRGRRRGHGHGRGRAARETPADLLVALDPDQAPDTDAPAAPVQAPAVPIMISGLQEALAQILSVCTGLAQAVSATTAVATSQAGRGNQTPTARTPEQVVQGLQMSGPPSAQSVAPAQEFVVPVMPDDEQRRLERSRCSRG